MLYLVPLICQLIQSGGGQILATYRAFPAFFVDISRAKITPQALPLQKWWLPGIFNSYTLFRVASTLVNFLLLL